MIRIENLEKSYGKRGKNRKTVLKKINLKFPEKGMVCIVGESGCGKTTLLNTIGGLASFEKGRIVYDDQHIITNNWDWKKWIYNKKFSMDQLRSKRIGYIFQNYYLIPEHTVEYNVELALKLYDLPESEKHYRIERALDAVGMKRYKKKKISELSGGQQQRISIARALVKSPDIILADEPTGSLDEENTLRVMNILKEISKQCLVILVSHEINMVQCFADRIIYLEDGIVKSDELNEGNGEYEPLEDGDIYLQDLKRTETRLGEVDIQLYQSEEEAKSAGIRMVWRRGKLYIQGMEQIDVILAGPESRCQFIDGKRKEIPRFQDMANFCLAKIKGKCRQSFPLKDIRQMAQENLRYMGKKRRSISSILIVVSLLLSFTVTDFMIQNSIDRQAVQKIDSHLLSVSFSPIQGANAAYVKKQMYRFYDWMQSMEEYTSISTELPGVLNIYYEGFPQMEGQVCRLNDFSVVSLVEIESDDLVCGRMPENRNEIVIDQWLLDRYRKESTGIQELLSEKEYVLGLEASVVTGGRRLQIVGISDTNEPSVYVSDSVILGMSYLGYLAMTDDEIRQLDVAGFEELELSDEEIWVSEKALADAEKEAKEGQAAEEWLLSQLQSICGEDCEIAEYFGDDLGIDYIVSEKNLEKMVKSKVMNLKQCQIYTRNPEEEVIRIRTEAEKYKDCFGVSVVQTSKEQLQAYQNEHSSMMQTGYLVTALAVFLSVIVIYFTMKSHIINQKDELVVYQLLGIPKSNIVKIYALEMAWITFCSCTPIILASFLVVKYIASIPSLELYLYLPWWIAGAMLSALVCINALLGVLSVRAFFKKGILEV